MFDLTRKTFEGKRNRSKTIKVGLLEMLEKDDLISPDAEGEASVSEEEKMVQKRPIEEVIPVIGKDTYATRVRNRELKNLREKIQDINRIIKVVRDIYCH